MTRTVTFTKMGDFLEAFDDDASEIAKALDITLASRNGRPMAGIPIHSAATYAAALREAGIEAVGHPALEIAA